MINIPLTLFCAALSVSPALAVNLYAATSDGNVTSLALANSNGTYSLAITSKTAECEANPAWLTLDSEKRILYCLDRGVARSVNGSINSFNAGPGGNLTRVGRTTAPLSGVHMGLFGPPKNRGIISVFYNKSATAVTSLRKDGHVKSLVQIIRPTLEVQGPVRLRQDTSYMHQIQQDPTGKYLFGSDLGGDRIRVYTFDNKTHKLTEQAPLRTEPGVGPRHGVFWKSSSKVLYYIFVGEISQKVYTYQLTYAATGVTWTKVSEIVGLGNDNEKPAGTAPQSGIVLSPDNKFLIVSHRDISFRDSTQFRQKDTDTLSTFHIKDNGSLELIQLSPSGGYSPRQFSFNKSGNMIAVGHQLNRTVVIWKRDVATGLILAEVNGGKAAVQTLTGEVVCTIWDE